MTLPTVESITNRYLYKQDDVINNRLDDKIISRDESSIAVDKKEFMKGPGRFITAENFSLVSKIFTMEGVSGITEPREKTFFANLGDGC
jgi:apxIVA var3